MKMSSDPTRIGLSEQEAGQLVQPLDENATRIGIWFSNHLCNYLRALSLDAASENHAMGVRRSTRLRQETMLAFENYFGRTPTPDDLINELSRFVIVPHSVSAAIRQDLAGLLACSAPCRTTRLPYASAARYTLSACSAAG
jgi:hypothetical protein